jgi:hypothetical protein
MGDLYFIEYPGKLVYTYSRRDDGTWRMSRIAPCQNTKLVWVLLYSKDKASWVVQDQSPGSKSESLGLPIVAAGVEQSPEFPPLGSWRFAGYRCEVTDSMPLHPCLDPFPATMDVPFATLRYSETGNIARLDTKVNNTVITDEALEDLLRKLANVARNLATRPAMILLLHSDGNDAAMPSFSQIRRFLAWIQENGPELFLIGRGSAIVLKPRGVIGYALVNIVRMVQRMLPPPWPEVIVNTSEEAEAFLEQHSKQYREDVAGRFNQQLVNGAFSEAELGANGCPSNETGSKIGNQYLKAKIESILPKVDHATPEYSSEESLSACEAMQEPEVTYKLGEDVQKRDKGQDWRPGVVTNVEPLRVDGYSWNEVRKLPQALTDAEWPEIAMEGHTRPIRSMAIWPQGGVSRSQDGTPRIWSR